MAAILHNVVGLQHASMAIFNAWCDRAPMLLLGGTGPLAVEQRRPWIDWIHTALVQGQAVRDFVKWDDQPASLASIPEAIIRGYRIAGHHRRHQALRVAGQVPPGRRVDPGAPRRGAEE